MVVVANVSREVIPEAASRFVTRVVVVTAPPEVLAARLAARGRETQADVVRRLARNVPMPDHVAVETVVNDGKSAQAADRFIAALTRAALSAPPR